MIVVLCHPGDDAAVWLHEGLCRHTPDVELVTMEQLVYSRHIVHRLDDRGDTGAITLTDGRVLRPQSITGVVNRVRYLPTQHFAAARAADRDYATEELGALALAWLDSVAGRVINPARPFDLGGGTVPAATVAQQAAQAGLPLPVWRADSRGDTAATLAPATHAVIAFDGRVYGSLIPRELQEGCRRLSVLLGLPLLQVQWVRGGRGEWTCAGASGVADLRLGGAPLVSGIARALVTEEVFA